MKKYLLLLYKFVLQSFKRRDGGCFILLVIWLISFLLLLWAFHIYQDRTRFMTERIFQVIGHDRNTSMKAFPISDTSMISPSRSCQHAGKNALAIILVTSMTKNNARREIVRTTWASQQYITDIMVFFFVGKPDYEDISDLQTEARQHRDLIVDDLEEDYYALGIKSLRMLKWFGRNCPESRYFIKVDDDVLVNLPLLSIRLKELNPVSQQVGGRLLTGRTPNVHNPFSKWYTPREMWPPDSKAPNYIGGPFYIIKGDLVPPILSASSQVPLYHLEDVFITGMIAAQKLNYQLFHFPGSFDPKYPSLSYYWHYFWDPTYSRKYITSFHTDGDIELMRTIYTDSISY